MTIRPLSSRVIFVAPRNMAHRARARPFPPTFSHQAPLWNRGRAMSIQNSEKFVAFTKTYVENHSVGKPCGAFIVNNQRFAERTWMAALRPRVQRLLPGEPAHFELDDP